MKTGKSTMTDKISNITGPINGAKIQKSSTDIKGSESEGNATGATPSNKVGADQVDISSAQTLEQIRESLASQPIVDRQKVEAIKLALQDGTYTINSENIAAKLIEFEQLLK